MNKEEYLEMASEIAQEWLQEIIDDYPYREDENGDIVYTEEAQKVFNRLIGEVINISGQYITLDEIDTEGAVQ